MGATWVAEYGLFKIIGCCLMGNHLLAKTLPEYREKGRKGVRSLFLTDCRFAPGVDKTVKSKDLTAFPVSFRAAVLSPDQFNGIVRQATIPTQ
jgi:hypothetical protein